MDVFKIENIQKPCQINKSPKQLKFSKKKKFI